MKIRIKKFEAESIVILMFSILPIIDSVNGYLATEGKFSIGTLYKMVVLVVLAVLIFLKSDRADKRDLMTSVMLIGFVCASIGINVGLGGTIISKEFPIKFIFNILTLVTLMQLVKQKIISGNAFYRIFDIGTLLMVICIMVPYILKVGYSIYSGNIGYKGFFYSQNELTAVLLILLYFSLYNLICNFSIKSILQTGGISLSILLTNTKSSMIACALGVVVFVIEYLRRRESKHKMVLIALAVVVIVGASGFVGRQIAGFMQRQTSLSNMYGKSIIATITSGRSYYIADAWSELMQNGHQFLKILIGNGFCSNVLVEMDFLDMFFFLGLTGVLGYCILGFWVYKKSARNYKSDHTIIRRVGFLIVLAFSFLTGHIVFYATSGCYFILLCLFDLYYETSERKVAKRCRSLVL